MKAEVEEWRLLSILPRFPLAPIRSYAITFPHTATHTHTHTQTIHVSVLVFFPFFMPSIERQMFQELVEQNFLLGSQVEENFDQKKLILFQQGSHNKL